MQNPSEDMPVNAHCLPFHQVPHTMRLFSDFLYDYPQVQKFFPSSPYILRDLPRAQSSYDPARRGQVASILERQNRGWNASSRALENISRLRDGASAVVTGQQVGLFGGPVFAIYKALTAAKLAEQATAAGVNSVPIFWLATEDHDLAEINHVSIARPDFSLDELRTQAHVAPDTPVGRITLDDEIVAVIDRASEILGQSDILGALRESYRPGSNFGDAFARLFATLFADFGIILLDPSDAEFHRIAEPVLRNALDRSDELDQALLARGKELERAGYHQQVKVTESSTLLFSLEDGRRTVIHRKPNGSREFQIRSSKISKPDLLRRIADHPEAFSANVLLRPVMQDYLLPTIAYVGGSAEVAYFAQCAVVYEALLGRITPITPRFSATIVEPKPANLLRRYGLTFHDSLQGLDPLREELARRALPQDVQSAFENAHAAVQASLDQVKGPLSRLDPTLLDAATRAASKMEYQISRLRSRAARAELRRVEVLGRHAILLSNALYPHKTLQERQLGGIYFLLRYGTDFLQQVYHSVRTDCLDHQVIEI
ncbi:MAG TPA: bacillithiol biosynthesis cysteine-adding enzyme BshC [Terriglobales bacterium]|nr:bacillithiol biosynthesis cysteine-adding enzyme BshC [Terriglobales bacterium]